MEEYPYDKSIIKKIQNYKYIGGDTSIIYHYILSPFAQFWVNLIPTWIAPNLITALGLLLPTILTILTIIFNPNLNSIDAPRWLYLCNGITLFMYQTMDNMDGKQARRTGTSSPLGMLFDHGCDAIQSCISSISMSSVLGLGWSGAFSMFLLVGLPFFMSTWEHYHIGEMFLPIINGPTEGLLLAMMLCSFSYCYGCQWWHSPFTYTASYVYMIPKMTIINGNNGTSATYLHYYFKNILNMFSNSSNNSGNVGVVGDEYYNDCIQMIKVIGQAITWLMNTCSMGILRYPCMILSGNNGNGDSSGSSSGSSSSSGGSPSMLLDLDLIINNSDEMHVDDVEENRYQISHVGVVFSSTPLDLFLLFSNFCVCSTVITHLIRTFLSENKNDKKNNHNDTIAKVKNLYPILVLAAGLLLFLHENVAYLSSLSPTSFISIYSDCFGPIDDFFGPFDIVRATLTLLLSNNAVVLYGCIFVLVSLTFTDICIALQTCEISGFTYPWFSRCYTGYLLGLVGIHHLLIQIYNFLLVNSTSSLSSVLSIDESSLSMVIYSAVLVLFIIWYNIFFKRITTHELNHQYNTDVISIWGIIRLMLRLSSVGVIIIVYFNVAFQISNVIDKKRVPDLHGPTFTAEKFTVISHLHVALLLLAGVLDGLSIVPFMVHHYVSQVRKALNVNHVFKI